MVSLKNPAIAGALAAAIASTTGYCVLQRGVPDEPPPVPATTSPVRPLPEAVLPYPLEEPN